jgi:hypothetical protein
MKKVKEGLKEKGASDDDVKAFETGAQAFAKKIVGNFKDYEFLIGESMDPDGMYVFKLSPSYATLVLTSQGHPTQLPRGWHYSLCHRLEAWSY